MEVVLVTVGAVWQKCVVKRVLRDYKTYINGYTLIIRSYTGMIKTIIIWYN